MEPLVRRVRSAALTAGANRDRRLPHRQRDVGVGRRAVEMGPDAEVRVDGSHVPENRAPSASFPPGREPTSFNLAETRPPVDRSFSNCRELSIDAVNSSTNSSIRAALSDRISTFDRASVGIELMLDPPSIVPKL